MKKILGIITALALIVITVGSAPTVMAQCAWSGQCINNRVCVCVNETPDGRCIGFDTSETTCTGDFNFGQLDAPPGVAEYNTAAGATADQPAIIYFLSRMIRLAAIVGGVWVLINVIIAAFFYITGSGDAGAHAKVRNLLTASLVGLILIVSFYTMGAIIGLVFFGDATFILNPQL